MSYLSCFVGFLFVTVPSFKNKSGIISSIDKPASPSSEAMADLYANLSGKTSEKRKRFRDSVIHCTVEKLKEVTKKYLMARPRRALVSGRKFEKQLTSMGFTIRDV